MTPPVPFLRLIIPSSACSGPHTVTVDVLLCLFQCFVSHFLIHHNTQTCSRSSKHMDQPCHCSQSRLSPVPHPDPPSVSSQIKNDKHCRCALTRERKQLVCLCLLKPSDSAFHHFPPLSKQDSPLAAKKGSKHKEVTHACCVLIGRRGLVPAALLQQAQTTACELKQRIFV